MRVLIFYASYGGGHLSAANAIKQYIDANYSDFDVRIVDCMKYINTGIEKITTDSYKIMAEKVPWAWGRIYKRSGKGPIAHLSKLSSKVLSLKLYKLFEEFSPDIVISTHPFSSQMTTILKKQEKTNCKLATVLTDFAPHNQWLFDSQFVDFFFVAHDGMKKDLALKGISDNKIFVTGIPLSTKFLQHFDKNSLKKSFDLDLSKRVILFFGGGEFGLGEEHTSSILEAFIDNIGNSYEIIVISGKNTKMQERFDKIVLDTHSSDRVKVYGYTNKIPELMAISDLVVTKPGGLTSTESLASGLPMVVINPIPGQEEENAVFLEKAGVALWLRKKENVNEAISELLSNERELHHMKTRSRLMAKKNSTADICKVIFG